MKGKRDTLTLFRSAGAKALTPAAFELLRAFAPEAAYVALRAAGKHEEAAEMLQSVLQENLERARDNPETAGTLTPAILERLLWNLWN